MPGKLNVDIPQLHSASAGVSNEQSTLSTSHGQSVSNVDSASAGWIGSSAQALSSLTGSWQRATTVQSTRIENHAGDMSTAAQLFSYMEDRHTEALCAVAEGATPRDL